MGELNREAAAQQPPAPELNLTGFPTQQLPAAHPKWRAHSTAHGPWFFSSTGGRFDLPEPHGTCYMADSVETAVREYLGGVLAEAHTISAYRAQRMTVSLVYLPAGRYANINRAEGIKFGVTRELMSMVPYSVPQLWAAAFFAHSFDGIHYASGHTAGAHANAWALFGPGGPADLSWSPDEDIDGAAACRRAGVIVSSDPVTTVGLDIRKPG